MTIILLSLDSCNNPGHHPGIGSLSSTKFNVMTLFDLEIKVIMSD